jgi:hypothetical protein
VPDALPYHTAEAIKEAHNAAVAKLEAERDEAKKEVEYLTGIMDRIAKEFACYGESPYKTADIVIQDHFAEIKSNKALREEVAGLKSILTDPATLYTNMLRGTVPTPLAFTKDQQTIERMRGLLERLLKDADEEVRLREYHEVDDDDIDGQRFLAEGSVHEHYAAEIRAEIGGAE